MIPKMHVRPTYANVAMTLALVFAMSGGAYAAKRYLITSIKQINPKVVKQLKGKNGAPGLAGSQGLAGANGKDGAPGPEGKQGIQGPMGLEGKEGKPGPAGPEGSPWTAGGVLPSGKSERGTWSIIFAGESASLQRGSSPISFTIPLKTGEIKAHLIGTKEELAGEANESPAIQNGECSGSVVEPQAAEGNLCIFSRAVVNASCCAETNILDPEAGAFGTAGRGGAVVTVISEHEGTTFAYGTWIVTAQ